MGRLKSTSRIREIFWLPSVSSADEFDMVEFALDDDHFASKLAELGFAVHLIQPKEIEKSPLAVMESVNWRIREGKLLGRQMAIIGQELSSAHVLNYLSEIALPMTLSRVDIGAVILIDPFSLYSLKTSEGREALLSRFIEPLLDSNLRYELNLILFPEKITKFKKKKKKSKIFIDDNSRASSATENESHRWLQSYLKRWDKLGPIREMLIESLKEKLERQEEQLVGIGKSLNAQGQDNESTINFEGKIDVEFEFYEQRELFQSSSSLSPSLFGKFPCKLSETATALENRILIISSQFEEPSNNFNLFTSPWSGESVEEVANLLRAGPVIYLKEQEFDEFSLSDPRGKLASSDKENHHSKWEKKSVRRHQQLFDTISSWLFMLSQFQYI